MIPLPAEDRFRVAAALREQQATGEARLRPVFERFEGRYDYGLLKCVAASLLRGGG